MFVKKITILLPLAFSLLCFSCRKNEQTLTPIPAEAPKILVGDLSVPEGDEQHFVQLEVKISGERKEAVSLSFETRDGTAEAENDYVPAWGTLAFPVGNHDTSQTIAVKILTNKFAEEDEYFEVRFFDIKNAEPAEALSTITLLNDDEPHDTFPGYTTPLEYPGMTLAWHDEFDVVFANGNWTHATGTGCPNLCGWGNNELQYYRPENTTVDNGLLTITAKEENYSGSDYTSSRILSKDKFEFKFGRVDIRAKLPKGKGIWPALWMLGANRDDVGWPACGEVDIMELRGSLPRKICGTVHYQNASGNHQNTYPDCHVLLDGTTYNDLFHVFSIVWDAERMTWYLDDQKFNEELFSNLNLGSKPNPFLQEFYFLLNVAAGGNYDGDPDGTTEFPQKMEVDYIRVFQQD